MYKKAIIWFILLFTALNVQTVHGEDKKESGLTVSPAYIILNEPVETGSVSDLTTFKITNRFDEKQIVKISSDGFIKSKTRQITVQPNETVEIETYVEVPKNANVGRSKQKLHFDSVIDEDKGYSLRVVGEIDIVDQERSYVILYAASLLVLFMVILYVRKRKKSSVE